MTPKQVLALLAFLNRAGLLHAVEGQAEVWARALSHTSIEDAQAAADRLLVERTSESRWVVPGDLLASVRTIRAARVRAALGGAEPVPPREVPADDVEAYQAWRKAFLRSLGDGKTVHAAEVDACGAAGVPVVHRAIEAHQVPQFRRLESR